MKPAVTEGQLRAIGSQMLPTARCVCLWVKGFHEEVMLDLNIKG